MAHNFGYCIVISWVFYTSLCPLNSSILKTFVHWNFDDINFHHPPFNPWRFRWANFLSQFFKTTFFMKNFLTRNYEKQWFFSVINPLCHDTISILTQITFSLSEAFRSLTVFWRNFWSQTCFWTTHRLILFWHFCSTIIVFFSNKEISATGFFAKHFSVDDTTSWPHFGSMTSWQNFSVNNLYVTFFGQ